MLSKLVVAVLVFYGVLVLGLALFQRSLLYFPDRTIAAPTAYGLTDFQEVAFTAADGTRLHGWYKPAQPGRPTLLYFQGNAGNGKDRVNKFRHFTDTGFGLFALHYRGYGHSEGRPSEQGIYTDARAAYTFLTTGLTTAGAEKPQPIAPEHIVLYGESLGTGVATQLASEQSAAALILEAPYTATVDRAAEIYRLIPVRWIMWDRFESREKIGKVRIPVLILHGENDLTIPAAHGKRLFALANNPKHAVFFPGIGHTDFDLPALTQEVVNFLAAQGIFPARAP